MEMDKVEMEQVKKKKQMDEMHVEKLERVQMLEMK